MDPPVVVAGARPPGRWPARVLWYHATAFNRQAVHVEAVHIHHMPACKLLQVRFSTTASAGQANRPSLQRVASSFGRL